MKLRIKNTAITLKIIGWLEVIGGVTGLWLMAYLLMKTNTINGPVLLIFLIGFSLFIFSIYCGNALLVATNKKRSIVLVIINQFLQLFQWGIFGYSFRYSSGIELLIGIKGLSLSFNTAFITSNFSMFINSDHQFFFEINLIPILLIIVLFDILGEMSADSNRKFTESVAVDIVAME